MGDLCYYSVNYCRKKRKVMLPTTKNQHRKVRSRMEGTDSLRCGEATAVATVHWTVAKSRLSNPMSSPTRKSPIAKAIGLFLVGEDGFEPSKRYAADLQSVPFGHSGTPPYVVVCSWSR